MEYRGARTGSRWTAAACGGADFMEYGGDVHGTYHGNAVACRGKCHGT